MPTTSERTATLPIATLLEDLAIYPRHEVNDQHVNNLVKALEAGARFPPFVASRADKRLVDGWHRRRAILRFRGSVAVVEVILRDYADDQELLLDAIRLNADHGKPLETYDYVRITTMCENMGISDMKIATVLHRQVAEIQKYKVRVAHVPLGSVGIIPTVTRPTPRPAPIAVPEQPAQVQQEQGKESEEEGKQPAPALPEASSSPLPSPTPPPQGERPPFSPTVVLKRPVLHLAGQMLSERQAEALPRAPGVPYRMLARQLIDAVEADLADRHDESLMEILRKLRDALILYFEKQPKR